MVACAAALGVACASRAGAPSPPAPTATAPGLPAANIEPVGAGADAAAELDAFFRARFPADAPGIAVLIAKRGQPVWRGAYGLADLQAKTPISTRTVLNLGSLSKTFVANAILILAERGKLSVDDALLTYFPDFAHPEVVRGVQLRHLLTHTSGLPDLRPMAEPVEFYLTARDPENWAPEKAVAELAFLPGTNFAYSNPAFNGLALVVEQVAHRPWQAFVADEIFRPAGMANSTITDGPEPSRGVAHGYALEGGAWVESDYGEVPTFAAAGNGGVWSSVEDLARYEHALANATFLSAETIADSRTIKTFDNWSGEAPPKIGWSWFIKDVDGQREIGHTGSQGGFMTNYFVVPDQDVLVVYLMNRDDGDLWDAVNAELHRWLTAHAWLSAGTSPR